MQMTVSITEWKRKPLSRVWLFATPWTVAQQAPLSTEFSNKNPEWLAIPFSRWSCQPRDRTRISCIAGRFFTVWVSREALLLPFKAASWKLHTSFQLMPNWPELSSVAILSCGNEVRELEVLNLCGKCPATKRRFYYQEKELTYRPHGLSAQL